MTLLKSVMVAAVLLTGGSSLAIAQNGPATGGEQRGREALMAVVGVVAGMVPTGMVALPPTATPTHACIATIGLTGTTGVGVTTKQWRR
jgi:hypothetical protein